MTFKCLGNCLCFILIPHTYISNYQQEVLLFLSKVMIVIFNTVSELDKS